MTEYNPVGWFEIPVTDMARAKEFYQQLLDIEIEEHEMGPLQMGWFPMVQEGKGATGSLVKGETYVPSQDGTLVYLSTPDIDQALEKVVELGGKVLAPKRDLGEYGFSAAFEDTEGNRVALHMNK